MATNNQMPTNADVFARRAQRREALANAMLQQSLTPAQGQQTWLSPIQKIVEAFMASRLQKRADQDYQQFVDTKKALTSKELQDYAAATGGDGLAPNTPEMLISRFGNASSPVVQAMLQEEIKLGAKRKEQDFTLKDTINDRDPTTGLPRQMGVYQSGRVAALPGLGAPLAPLTFQGQVGLDQFTGKPIQQAPADPEDLVIRGQPKPGEVVGDMQINPLAVNSKGAVAAAGRPTNVTTFNVSTLDKLGEVLPKDQIDRLSKGVETGSAFIASLPSIARTQKILDAGNLFTGFGADLRKDAARFADVLGLGGRTTQEKIANSEAYIRETGQRILPVLQALRPASDTDVKIAERMQASTLSVSLPEMRRAVRAALSDGYSLVRRHNAQVGKIGNLYRNRSPDAYNAIMTYQIDPGGAQAPPAPGSDDAAVQAAIERALARPR